MKDKTRKKNILLNKNSHSIYRQRLTKDKWIQKNVVNITIISLVVAVLAYVAMAIMTRLIDNAHNIVWSDWKTYVLWANNWTIQLIAWAVWALIVLTIVLLLSMDFLRKVTKKNNWVKDERYGSGHFLTDERLPWTQFPKLEKAFFPHKYYLDQGDWIIRLKKSKDINEFLNQYAKVMEFKQKDAQTMKNLVALLKNPLGRYEEKVKYTSANDAMRDLLTISKQKTSDSEVEFKDRMRQFIRNNKLNIFEVETAGDAPNAFVIGSTGSGKTTKLNYPTIIANANAINQPSMLITDPKGELYAKLSGYLTARGYEPYSLDLFDLIRSMGWNPLQDVYSKFCAKSLLKVYLKQYDEWRRFYNTTLENDEIKTLNEVINNDVELPYPDLTKDEYTFLQERMQYYRMNESRFVFDDRYIQNKYAFENHTLNFKSLQKDAKELGEYVCSIHTLQKANDCHTCYPNAKMFILFDNYVFMSENALRIHLSTTLPTQISEQINIIKNAIFNTEGESDKHWSESAGKAFNGALYSMGYRVEDDINSIFISKFNIFSVVSLITDEEIFNSDIFKYIPEVEQMMDEYQSQMDSFKKQDSVEYQEAKYHYALAKTRFQEYKTRMDFVLLKPIFETGDRERGSIKSVLSTKLNPFTNDGVKLLTSFSDITFNDLIDDAKPKVIFIGVNVNDPTYHPFITLFTSILHQKLSEKAKKTPANAKNGFNAGCLNRRFLFMLDEFGNIPPIPNLGRILSTCRSEGIKFMLIVQSIGQISKNYKEDKQTIITNCGMNVFIKTDELDTAKYYSDILGKTTIETEDTEVKDDNKFIPKTRKRFAFSSRSLMEVNELYNIDCSKYHDTLFITKVKQGGTIPLLVQETPWYIVFKTKDFETYRPIQYKENKYSLLLNQLDLKIITDFYTKQNILSQYQVINKDNLLSKLNSLAEEDLMRIKEEVSAKTSSVEQHDGIYDYLDLLIKHYELKFSDANGINQEAFAEILSSYEDFVSKQLLFQYWNILGVNTFSFSKEDFNQMIKDYLAKKNQNDTISQKEIENYHYNFNEESINEFLVIQAKNLLVNQDKGIDEIKEQYPNVANALVRVDTYLQYIFSFELLDYINSSTDNDIQLMYNFLARYKNGKNEDITIFSRFIKSLVSIVDKEINYQYSLLFTDKMNIEKNFKLHKYSKVEWYKDLLFKWEENKGDKLLFIDYWDRSLKDLFANNEDAIKAIQNQ